MKIICSIVLAFFHLQALACTNVSPELLKKVYFNTIASDAENLGLFCFSKTSNHQNCMLQGDEFLKTQWDDYANRSKIGIISILRQEDYGQQKVCTFRLKIALAISTKAERTPNDFDPSINLKFKVKSQPSIGSVLSASDVSVSRDSWYVQNVEQVMGKDNNGREWFTAPIASSVTQFRRFLLLGKFLDDLRLTERNRMLLKSNESKIDDLYQKDVLEKYLEKRRFE